MLEIAMSPDTKLEDVALSELAWDPVRGSHDRRGDDVGLVRPASRTTAELSDRKAATRIALSVLVVEDDAMIGLLLAEMLEEMGYDVCAVAATEEAAVADAARCRPGLMIVDQQLREGSGISAVERILRNGPVPCVFISGAPVYVARPGANVLQKPFLEEDLVRAIRYVVGSAVAPPVPLPGPGHVVQHH